MKVESPAPEKNGALVDLVAAALDPVAGELVEARLLPLELLLRLFGRLPDSAADVGEHVLQLLLCPLPGPALRAGPERDVTAPAAGVEPRAVDD